MTYATVTIEVEVHDKQLLFEAALANFEAANERCADATAIGFEMFKPGGGDIDIGACLTQLFDPGTSPDGCQIEGSTAEVHYHLDTEEA